MKKKMCVNPLTFGWLLEVTQKRVQKHNLENVIYHFRVHCAALQHAALASCF